MEKFSGNSEVWNIMFDTFVDSEKLGDEIIMSVCLIYLSLLNSELFFFSWTGLHSFWPTGFGTGPVFLSMSTGPFCFAGRFSSTMGMIRQGCPLRHMAFERHFEKGRVEEHVSDHSFLYFSIVFCTAKNAHALSSFFELGKSQL